MLLKFDDRITEKDFDERASFHSSCYYMKNLSTTNIISIYIVIGNVCQDFPYCDVVWLTAPFGPLQWKHIARR